MAKRKRKLVRFWQLEDEFRYDDYEDGNLMIEMPGCCGIIELIGLERGRTPELVAAVAQRCGEGDPRSNHIIHPTEHNLFVFTDNITRGFGTKLAAYVRKHRLGQITASPICINPRHNSRVQGWFWKVNRTRLRAWARRNVEWVEPEDEKDEKEETNSLPVW